MAKNKTSLIDEYKKLARKADDRLRALEKLSQQPNFKNVKNFAYKNAMRDIQYWGGTNRYGKGKRSYADLSYRQLNAKIRDIKNFLYKSSTSTKTDIIKLYQKRADTLNDKLRLDGSERLTWDEWADFWRSDLYQEMMKFFKDSDTVVDVVSQFVRDKETILNAIRKRRYKDVQVEPDFLRDTTVNFLQKHKTQFSDLLSGIGG